MYIFVQFSQWILYVCVGQHVINILICKFRSVCSICRFRSVQCKLKMRCSGIVPLADCARNPTHFTQYAIVKTVPVSKKKDAQDTWTTLRGISSAPGPVQSGTCVKLREQLFVSLKSLPVVHCWYLEENNEVCTISVLHVCPFHTTCRTYSRLSRPSFWKR